MLPPINFNAWLKLNRHLLKPPIGNKVIYKNEDFIVMAVGGPNERTDFHVNQGEEFFYQMEGNSLLKIMDENGQMKEIVFNEGDMFLLPKRVPHSPQRYPNSLCLVIERVRQKTEKDGLQWYCENCLAKLYEEFFILTDVEKDFQKVFKNYFEGSHHICKSCHTVNGRTWLHAKEN